MGAREERLEVRVIPRARLNEVGGERAGRLVVRVTAAPVDDQANVAVRKLVAHHLGVRLNSVEIVSGHHARDKVLRIIRERPRASVGRGRRFPSGGRPAEQR